MPSRNEIEILLKAIDAVTPILQKIQAEAQKLGAEAQAAGAEAEFLGQGLEAGAEEGAGAVDELAQNTARLQGELTLLGVAAAGAFYALAREAQTAIDAYNRLESATIGLDAVAAAFGQDQAKVRQALQEVTADGLLPLTDAAAALKNLLATGYGIDDAVRLLNALKDAAAFNRQAHLSFAQAVVSASEGIKNGNSILVDNAGITKNLSLILEEAGFSAQDLMKASSDLSVRQAILNGILREAAPFTGNAALMAQQLAGEQARAAKAAEELQAALGGAMAPALQTALDRLLPLLETLKEFVAEHPKLVSQVFAATGALVGLGAALVALTKLAEVAKVALAATFSFTPAGILRLVGLIGAVATVTYSTGKAADEAQKAFRQLQAAQEEVAKRSREAVEKSHRAQQAAIGDTIKQEKELARVREQAAKQEERRIVQQVNRLYSNLVQALRKRYDEEEKSRTKALDRQLDQVRAHYKREIEALDEATRRQKELLKEQQAARERAIQAQIEEIDRLLAAQEQANREADRQRQEAEIKEKLLTAGVDPEEAKRLMDELAGIELERRREADRQALEQKRDALRAELDATKEAHQRELDEIDRQAEEKKRRLEEESRAQEEALRHQREAVQAHYAELKETVERQAMDLMQKLREGVTGAYDEVNRILQAYLPAYEVAGLSAGELWLRGFQAPDIPAEVKRVMDEANNAGELIKKAAAEAEKEWRAAQETIKAGLKDVLDASKAAKEELKKDAQEARQAWSYLKGLREAAAQEAAWSVGVTLPPRASVTRPNNETVIQRVFGKDLGPTLNINGGVNIKIEDPNPARLSTEITRQIRREAGLLGGAQFR